MSGNNPAIVQRAEAPAWLSALHESIKPILHRVRKREDELGLDRAQIGKLIWEAGQLPAVQSALAVYNMPSGPDGPKRNGRPMTGYQYVARLLADNFHLSENTLGHYARAHFNKEVRQDEPRLTSVEPSERYGSDSSTRSETATKNAVVDDPVKIARTLALQIRSALFLCEDEVWRARLSPQQMLVFTKELATNFRELGINWTRLTSLEDGAEG